jgi:hypothetical protein
MTNWLYWTIVEWQIAREDKLPMWLNKILWWTREQLS